MTLCKGDVVTVTIKDMGVSGEGIGKADGFTLFIKDAVIGDRVQAKVLKVKKEYGYARLLRIEERSPFRQEPFCEIARQCGGCQIQELAYTKQLEFKQKKVLDDLVRIGGFSEEEVEKVLRPVIGMDEPSRFRNKAQLPVGERDGKPVAGFYAGRTHYIVPVSDCPISSGNNKNIVAAILHYMEKYHIAAYDEKTGKGLVRHILLRNGYYSGEVMVCLVINAAHLSHEAELIKMLRVFPEIKSISVNINEARNNVILGKQTRTIWGKDAIEDALYIQNVSYRGKSAVFRETDQKITFSISPQSFYQVNPQQTEKMYSLVRFFASLTGSEVVWDLYCGVGTISCFLAGSAGEVYGVEVIPDAIENARQNAKRNGLHNLSFQAGKVEEILPAYAKEHWMTGSKDFGKPQVDVVVVDPPRKGCDMTALETILAVRPGKVIYVSCDPATLARDLRILTQGGYRLQVVQPLDMFPHSIHVETVVLMSIKDRNPILTST